MMNEDKFRLQMKVREYECDAANGVNNAVYLNYLEYARYEFLRKQLKWDIGSLTDQGIGFVLVKVDIDYRRALEPNDEFVIETVMHRESKRRFLFLQEIYRLSDNKLVTSSRTIATAINIKTGKSETPDALEALLGEKYAPPPEEEATNQPAQA